MTAPDVRPVLLAYDGSAESQAALREAVALFGQRPLIVASVWEPGLAMATMMPPAGEPTMGYLPDPDEVAAIDRAQSGHAADVAEAGAGLARELGATAEALSVPDSANVAGTLIAIAEERDRRRLPRAGRDQGAHARLDVPQAPARHAPPRARGPHAVSLRLRRAPRRRGPSRRRAGLRERPDHWVHPVVREAMRV
jgi:nucleotide-binding universal stress UspA family protein